jgi:DNA-binding HxlR family transcriptional regulator
LTGSFEAIAPEPAEKFLYAVRGEDESDADPNCQQSGVVCHVHIEYVLPILRNVLTFGKLVTEDENSALRQPLSSRQQKVSNEPRGRADAHPPVAFCPRFHRAVELIGRRWTGAVLRVLMDGAKRFNELLGSVPGLSDRLLSERLRELEGAGLVAREVTPGPPVCVSYRLTEAGRNLEPVIDALGKWAERWISA